MSSKDEVKQEARQTKTAQRTRIVTILAALGIIALLVGPASTLLFRPAQAAHPTFAPGDVFVAVGSGLVHWYHPDGTLNMVLDTTLGGFTTGMAFDSAGNLYVTGFSVDQISVFDNTGTLTGTFGSGYEVPESIVFDAAGNAYVGSAGFATGDIQKKDSTGAHLASYDAATELRGTDWIDLAADQTTMFYTSEGQMVKRYDVGTDTQLADFAGPLGGSNAYALRIQPGGGVLVADTEDIKRLDATGAIVQTYDALGQDGWFALNLDPDGTSFWSADFSTADVYKFDIASGGVLDSFNTGTGSSTVFGLAVFGEFTAATEICGDGIDNDGDGLIDEGCPAENLVIRKFVQLAQEGFLVDEGITGLTQVKIVEATLVEPDRTTIHVYHDIPKDVPAIVLFSDPAWAPPITTMVDGKWELKLQIIATYEDPVTGELKNIEQKIIIQFDVFHGFISMPIGSNTIDLGKHIVISPHPAPLSGDMTIEIGEDITGETKVFVAEVTLGKPSGEIVSYTTLPIDITAGPVTIPYPGPGWVSSDGSAELDEVGMWELDIEIIGFYEDGTLAIKKVNQKLWISFNVIPETMIGTIALVASSLGGFVAFRRYRMKNSSNQDKPKRSGTSLGI